MPAPVKFFFILPPSREVWVGQAVLLLNSGLLEVFISETLILATASVRYEAINEKNNISIFFRKGEAIM